MNCCDHIIGFCHAIDNIFWESEKEAIIPYMEDTDSYLDIMFNYCPLCGNKLKL